MAEHRILLVEDDTDIAGAMAAILEGEGYSVVHAHDGTEALRALRGGLCPCVIVLDLLMPGMNGIEFRRVQRGDPSMSQLPVVVVSGIANMLDDVRSLGVARCFRKPVDVDELLGAVTELCPAA